MQEVDLKKMHRLGVVNTIFVLLIIFSFSGTLIYHIAREDSFFMFMNKDGSICYTEVIGAIVFLTSFILLIPFRKRYGNLKILNLRLQIRNELKNNSSFQENEFLIYHKKDFEKSRIYFENKNFIEMYSLISGKWKENNFDLSLIQIYKEVLKTGNSIRAFETENKIMFNGVVIKYLNINNKHPEGSILITNSLFDKSLTNVKSILEQIKNETYTNISVQVYADDNVTFINELDETLIKTMLKILVQHKCKVAIEKTSEYLYVYIDKDFTSMGLFEKLDVEKVCNVYAEILETFNDFNELN